MPPPAAALDRRLPRHRVGAGVRFGSVGRELDRHLRLFGADDHEGDAVAGVVAEVRVQVRGEPDAFDVGLRVRALGQARDFLVQRIVGRPPGLWTKLRTASQALSPGGLYSRLAVMRSTSAIEVSP